MGNYGSSHKGPDANNDGVVDVPYRIATTTGKEILDKYPLVNPPEIPWSLISGLEGSTTSGPMTTTMQPTETSPPYSTTYSTPPSTQSPTEYSAYVVLGLAIVAVAALAGIFGRRIHR